MSDDKRKYHLEIGDRLNRWTIIDKADPFIYGGNDVRIRWLCRCDCGTEREVLQCSLINGKSKSCGCMRIENANNANVTHHMSRSRIYSVYRSMIQRCYNETNNDYHNYGGRGIEVCDEWRCNFEAFAAWAYEHGYSDMAKKYSISLDRIDNDGNYSPENCRFTTYSVQGNNTRRNRYIVANGEKHTVAEWSRIQGVSPSRIRGRMNRGWDDNAIINERKHKGGHDRYEVRN